MSLVKLHTLLFPQYAEPKWKWGRIDLDSEARWRKVHPNNDLLDPSLCNDWVRSLMERDSVNFSYGGYMEDRAWLWRGHYHKPGATIHIGVDYNVPVHTLVRLPMDGTLVMVEQDPDQQGGWGTRAIYKIGDIYVTFAHLWFAEGDVGREYKMGSVVGEVGSMHTNGYWFPHLHVHCQKKYDPKADGYQEYRDELEDEFPDPEEVLVPANV